jgi:hypothetical protein
MRCGNAGVRFQGKTAGRRAHGLQFQMGALIIEECSFPLPLGGAYAQGFGVCFAMLAGEMPCFFFATLLGGFFLP